LTQVSAYALLGPLRSAIVKKMQARKQKVVYLITKGNWGGAQRYVYDLATNLPRDRFEAVVILGVGQELGRKLRARKIRVIQLSTLQRDINPLKEIVAFFQLFSYIRQEQPSVLHTNSSKAGLLGALISRMLGVQCIFTTHGWAFNESRNVLERKLFWILHWITILLSHKTIAVSNALKQQMVHAPFAAGKLNVVKDGINPPNFKSQREARNILAEYSPPLKIRTESKRDLMWIGTISELHKTKGLHYAIDSVAELKTKYPDIVFVIIGGGTERAVLEKHIREKHLEDTVFLLGFMKDASRCLTAFDIFTLTSISEALGYVLLEAGAAGLPVVATRVGGIPEIVKNGESGFLVPARDSKSIQKALATLLNEPKRRKRFGDMLKKQVGSKFSQAKMVNETLRHYQTAE